MTLQNFSDFRFLLVDSESTSNYRANNGIAFGLYQFTKARIKTVAEYLNESIPSVELFLTDRAMQDRFFLAHIELILAYIELNQLLTFEGKLITGKNKYPQTVPVNIYGIVAGAHLGGESGVKNFLQNNVDRKDKFGTYISDYVAKFSDKMQIVLASKKKTLITSQA